MKRPIFCLIARQIMIENKTLIGAKLLLSLSILKLKREIDRSLEPIVKWLYKQLTKIC